jgi:hypothetical protein
MINPFIHDQRNWDAYNTLADATAGIRFLQDGVHVYIILEDKWYYWRESTTSWVEWGGGGSTPTDSIMFSSSRNANVVKDQYLRIEDGTPSNQAPLLIPTNFILYAISVTTDINSTCSFELHNNEILIPGAIISLTGEKQKYLFYNIALTAGSRLMIYNRGTSSKPSVNVLLKRVP